MGSRVVGARRSRIRNDPEPDGVRGIPAAARKAARRGDARPRTDLRGLPAVRRNPAVVQKLDRIAGDARRLPTHRLCDARPGLRDLSGGGPGRRALHRRFARPDAASGPGASAPADLHVAAFRAAQGGRTRPFADRLDELHRRCHGPRGPINPTSARCGGPPRAPHSNGIEQRSGPVVRSASGENVRENFGQNFRESVMGNEMEMSSMEMPPPTLLGDPQAKEWEYLTHGSIVVERNRWFLATIIAGLIAAAAVAAVAMLLPLQKLVPLAVTVDSRTGLVTSVEYSKSVGELTQKEAIQRSDVARYVIAREFYDPLDLVTSVKLVRVMSDGNVWRQYEEETSQYNDSSPMKRYGSKVRRRIEVSTVLPIPNNANTYQVRYAAIEESLGAQANPVEKQYVSTVSFRYSDRPLRNEDRILNPLNFRAVAYRRDQELVNQGAAPGKGGTP